LADDFFDHFLEANAPRRKSRLPLRLVVDALPGLLAWFRLVDRPVHATWLSGQEKTRLRWAV
jgi:hypothetical protein